MLGSLIFLMKLVQVSYFVAIKGWKKGKLSTITMEIYEISISQVH